ncbi:MAG: DUF3090 family protein [Chloroflexota bacterium]|nr:DUF3090 family protein [Chloroflexota bacterium]
MNRRIFSFDPPDRFVCGALGQPGQRTFLLQAAKGGQVVSVVVEKAQVAVLAERLAALLLGLRERGVEIEATSEPDAEPLSEPVREEFRVGQISLAWDPQRERVVIEARELSELDAEDEDQDQDEGEGDRLDGPDLVRVSLRPAEAHAFVTRAVAVMRAGRPPCPNCGAPLDPRGHFCPRRNGYTH